MGRLDIVIGEEAPPAEYAEETSLSLRLAMVGARHVHFVVLLMGFITLLAAYITNAAGPMALSVACSVVTLVLAIQSAGARPASTPVPATSRRRFDWSAEVSNEELIQFGVVVMGALVLLVAYILDTWTMLALSACLTLLGAGLAFGLRMYAVTLAGLAALVSASILDAGVLFGASAFATLVLVGGLALPRDWRPGGLLDWNPVLTLPELSQFLFIIGGLLALMMGFVLDSWEVMVTSFGCTFMAVAGMLRLTHFGALLLGAGALFVAFAHDALLPFAISGACTAAVSISLAVIWLRERAVRIDWQAAFIGAGMVSLALAFALDQFAWISLSVVCSVLTIGFMVAAMKRTRTQELERDLSTLQAAVSEQVTWEDAVSRATRRMPDLPEGKPRRRERVPVEPLDFLAGYEAPAPPPVEEAEEAPAAETPEEERPAFVPFIAVAVPNEPEATPKRRGRKKKEATVAASAVSEICAVAPVTPRKRGRPTRAEVEARRHAAEAAAAAEVKASARRGRTPAAPPPAPPPAPAKRKRKAVDSLELPFETPPSPAAQKNKRGRKGQK